MRKATATVVTAAVLGAGTLTGLLGPFSRTAAAPEVSVAITASAPPAATTAPATGVATTVPATGVATDGTAGAGSVTTSTVDARPTTPMPARERTLGPSSTAIVTRSYSYGPHERHRLDVLTTESLAEASVAARRPTVVLVHGGSWVKGDKVAMHRAARDLVRAGYVAVPVNYRLAGQAAWPAQREDVQQAIGWVRERAGMLHVDTDRIVVLGSSAGGEIAASALTEGDGSRYARGLVTLSATLDLELLAAGLGRSDGMGTLAGIVVEQLLRCLPTDCADPLRAASALHHLDPGDPPCLVVTSREEWVDPGNSYRFHAAAIDHGVESDLHVLPGTQHGMSSWDRAWPTVRRWIDRRMTTSVG